MSVIAPPEPPRPDEPELLIREARARQRRRWSAAVAVAGLAIAAFAAYGVAGTGTKRTSSGSNSSAAALPRCRTEQLRLSAPSVWGAAAGSLLEPMTLANVSGSDCSLAGWPTVRRLDRAGGVVPARTFLYTYDATAPVPFRSVALRSGRAASFNFFSPDWDHAANRPCVTARTLEVKPPGDRRWLGVAVRIPACSALYVDPLVPGRTDVRWGTVGVQHFAHP